MKAPVLISATSRSVASNAATEALEAGRISRRTIIDDTRGAGARTDGVPERVLEGVLEWAPERVPEWSGKNHSDPVRE